MWFTLAVGAAALWGVSYALSEWLYLRISVLTFLTIEFATAAIVFALLSIKGADWSKDLVTLSSSRAFLALAVCVFTLIAAELCINYSISDKNATLASLVELSYPIFVALASYFIFRDSHLSASTVVGGLLIFAGITTIYVFNH